MTSSELPVPIFSEPAEDFSPPSNEMQCEGDPKARDGVLSFSTFVRKYLGGGNSGIIRHCLLGAPINGKPSGHYTGRSWDWTMNANDPNDVATVQKLIDWLFANNNEIWRRVGLVYVIWNHQSWSNVRKEWKPISPEKNQHTDHVHFSFGVDGADGMTSFYQWLWSEQPSRPTPEQLGMSHHYGWFAGGLLIGAASPMLLDYGYRLFKRTQRKAGRRA